MRDDRSAEDTHGEQSLVGDRAADALGPAAASLTGAARWRWLALGAAALVIIAIAVVLAVGGLRGSGVEESSPEYALQELSRAAERGDWDAMTRYLDVEAVAFAYADAALAHALGTDEGSSSGGSSGGMGGSVGLGRDMQGRFAERFAETLQAAVEARELNPAEGGLPGVLLSPAPDSVTLIGGTEATATVSVAGANGVEKAMLRMKLDGGHWCVVAVDGLSDLMGSLD